MEPAPVAAKFLERAILFTIACHGVAMVAMVLLLMPGMPNTGNIEQQMAYLSEHPWMWRLGWFPWQLTALSDLILGIALVMTPWIPKPAAWIALAFTLIAIGFEQPQEFLWSVQGVHVAQSGDVNAYQAFRDHAFVLTSYWAATFYGFAAIAWSFAFAKAKTWNRFLSVLSIATWGVLLAVSLPPLLFPNIPPAIVAAGDAIGFTLMMIWFVVVGELVFRRSRSSQAAWRLPYSRWINAPLELIGNSRLARGFGELFPCPPLRSDITDVVYLNYLVPADRLLPFVHPGLNLKTVDGHAVFTVLVYRHGHFGPGYLGPFRLLLPSPMQSNWRIYVSESTTGAEGVSFVTTTISNPFSALIGRIFAENLPMQVPLRSQFDGNIELRPGNGSSPDLKIDEIRDAERQLPQDWQGVFGDYESALEYLVPQDRALSSQPWYGQITRQEIHLGITPEDCKPKSVKIESEAIWEIVGDTSPLCFSVPKVRFRFMKTIRDRLRT